MTDILDIESILTTPWKVILGALAAAILFLIGALLLKSLLRVLRRRREEIHEERLSPLELFLLETRRLEQQKLSEKGEMRKYYFFLSEALRRYLGSEFLFPALDQTTEEIRSALAPIDSVQAAEREMIEAFLMRADRVKFADLKPSPEGAKVECESLISCVKRVSKK